MSDFNWVPDFIKKRLPLSSPSQPSPSLSTKLSDLAGKLWDWAKRPVKYVWRAAALAIWGAIIYAVFVKLPINWLNGPNKYYVYVVGDFDDNNLEKFREGFDEALQRASLQPLNNVKINIRSFPAKDKQAKELSARLANQNDTLLVIGHLSSTASADTLPNYLINVNPPVPVILAVETNPDLLPPANGSKYYPVFRLSPTDDRQAEKAAQFAIDHGARNIWVVEDVENSVYSHYLAEEFVRQVHEKSPKVRTMSQVVSTSQDPKKFAAYLKRQGEGRSAYYEDQPQDQDRDDEPKVLLWTKNDTIPPLDTMKALGINWVFFAGTPSNCLILTRQAKKILREISKVSQPVQSDKPKPNILLGNSCASLELLDQGGKDFNEAFLTHPMAADDFNKRGFKDRGTQAFQLLDQLIRGADDDYIALSSKNLDWIEYFIRWIRWKFGFDYVTDARNALNAFMEGAVDEHSFVLKEQRYIFGRDGAIREPAIHLWKVEEIGKEKAQRDSKEEYIEVDKSVKNFEYKDQ